MAALNINKVTLCGRLTATPELKQLLNGTSATNFSIAVDRMGKDQPCDFINCASFNKTAEVICRYFQKGMSIYVEGCINTRSWLDKKTGEKRFAQEVLVNEVKFVDNKTDSAPSASAPYIPSSYAKPTETQFEEVSDPGDLPF